MCEQYRIYHEIEGCDYMIGYDEVKEYIEQNSKCELLSEFVEIERAGEKINLRCECGREFPVAFNKFRFSNKRQCNICGKNNTKEKLKLSFEYVDNYIKEHNCTLLSTEYINIDSPLDIRCECGNPFTTTFFRFKDGKTLCDECASIIRNKKLTKTISKFKQEVFDLVGDEYTVVGDYIGAKTHILMRHNICGTEYPVTPTNFLTGYRCPHCHQSKAEAITDIYLKKNNQNYDREFTFDYLTGLGGNPLRFDFALFNDIAKTDLNFLVELDGEFHYRKIFKKDNYEILIEHDKRKNTYCKNNNIKLLRIPYWEFKNIEQILDNKLIPR